MNAAAPQPSRWRRRRTWIVAVGALVVLGAVLWVLFPSDDARFAAELERLHTAGFGTRPDEPGHDWPDEPENAGPLIEVAVFKLNEKYGSHVFWTAPGPWNPASAANWPEGEDAARLAETAQFLAGIDAYFDSVAQALERPRLATCVTYYDGSGEDRSHVDGQVVAATLIETLGARAAVDPDIGRRVASVGLLARVAGKLEDSPLEEVQIPAMHRAILLARGLATCGDAKAAAVRAVLDSELRPRWLPKFAEAMRREVGSAALGVAYQRGQPRSATLEERLRRIVGPAALATTTTAATSGGPPVDEVIAYLRASAELSRLPATSWRALRDGVVARRSEWPAVIAGYLQYAMPFAESLARIDAERGLARAALAAAERHDATGAWPATLDELRDAFAGEPIPLDPYTDAPFVYKVMDDAVRISSAGRCPEDDPIDDATLRERGLLWEFRK